MEKAKEQEGKNESEPELTGSESDLEPETTTGGDRGRHRGGGVPGSQRIQWSGVEQGGGLTKQAGTIKHDNVVLLIY